MAGGITVTPEQLQSISSQMSSGAAEIESILQKLASVVSPLHTDWVGVAQQQFEGLWTKWQTDARGLHEALTGVSTLTTNAASNYEQTEQNIAKSFG
jgi:WXG100 family type VII secretion target